MQRRTTCTVTLPWPCCGAGKHVLVEKPLATSVADALLMVAAAKEARVHLMVDFHARWHPLFMSARGYVERGELGAPVIAYARLSDTIYVPTEMLPWSGDSGPEWFLFPHTMDIVRWLFEPRARLRCTRKAIGASWTAWASAAGMPSRRSSSSRDGRSARSRPRGSCPRATPNVVDNRLSLYGEKGGLHIRNEPNLWAFTDRFHTPFSSESVTRYGKAWGLQLNRSAISSTVWRMA